jgi:urease accessory protein
MNPSPQARTLAPLALATTLLAVLAGSPAQAHSIADSGLRSGFLHPLAGTDHLFLLIAVGTAASCLGARLLVWGVAGAIAGGFFGAMGGGLPAAEVLAALAIAAVVVPVIRSQNSSRPPAMGFCGTAIAAAVAVHAMLHGQEAPGGVGAASWWLGAFGASLLVSGGSFLVLRKLPAAWTARLAMVLALGSGVLVLGPLGLLAR